MTDIATFDYGKLQFYEIKCRDSDSLSKFILNLNSDRQLAEKMGNASREYLQSNFTPEIIAKQYINVLEQSII
ncbi:MAG: hypothetical protein AN490_04950 [Anabaena sp. AL09]|nr:MAG: hypothetical protein AN490_04950 [Anabaena sp. AL09]